LSLHRGGAPLRCALATRALRHAGQSFVAKFVGSMNIYAGRIASGADGGRADGGRADGGLVFDAQIGTTEFLAEFVRHELTVGPLCVVADLPHARFA
jgi:hypothetical protein